MITIVTIRVSIEHEHEIMLEIQLSRNYLYTALFTIIIFPRSGFETQKKRPFTYMPLTNKRFP